jgi:hypothetical protein
MPRRQQPKRRRQMGLPSRKLTRAWHEVEPDEGFLSASPPTPEPFISAPPFKPLPPHVPDGTEQPPSWLARLAAAIGRWLSSRPRKDWP